MSSGKNETRNVSVQQESSPVVVPVAEFVEFRDWRDAWSASKPSQITFAQDDVRQFIEAQFGFTTEPLSTFDGDDEAVRNYFVEMHGDPDFGFVQWGEDEFGYPTHRYELTMSDLASLAQSVIENGWHKKDE